MSEGSIGGLRPPGALRPALRWLWRHQPNASFLLLRHRLLHGRFPRLFPPRTMNEKVLWRLLFDRRPVLRRFADKLAARGFVAERLGGDHLLPRLHAVFDRAEDAATLALPPRFVAKPTHGSHWILIEDGTRPPDRAALQAAAAQWLATDYHTGTREWAYRGLPRRVLVEEHLGQGDGVPTDYKFFCFEGRVAWVQALSGRFRDLRESTFDRDWRPVPMHYGAPPPDRPEPRPARLGAMLEVAEALSRGMDFLRVDLYDLPQGIRFGELTVYPSAAQARFDPPDWDEAFGRPWRFGRFGPRRPVEGGEVADGRLQSA